MADYGRVAPQAIEVERSLLGALLFDKNAYVVLDMLTEVDFHVTQNKEVFKAIQSLYESKKPIDVVSVEEKAGDKVPDNFVIGLSNEAYTYNFEYYAQILREKTLKRTLILESSEIIKEAYEHDSDPYHLVDKITRLSTDMQSGTSLKRSLQPSEIFKREENKPKAERLFTGFSKLDNGIYADSGMTKGQIHLTIADSGHGKTQYALWEAEMLLKQGYKILWFQLEDYDVKTAEHIAKNCPEQMDNMFICDSLYDIESIKREARLLNRDEDIDLIVFDYVQNIECSKQSRSDQIEYVSQQITRMAKELNVVCRPLSQVTISYGTRHGWKQEPSYGDVRWSQQLKQDAHLITSVFRPSRVETLVEQKNPETGRLSTKAKDWNGNLQPFNSVYVRQVKVRGGEQHYSRLHLIHGELGLKPYMPEAPF